MHLSHGKVLATTVGLEVPETGKFPVPSTSPCSFTVTLTAAAGRVPVRRARSPSSTSSGTSTTARHGPGRRYPAAVVRPGQTVMLEVRDVLPTGGGRLRWAPEGRTPIASWGFDVEID